MSQDTKVQNSKMKEFEKYLEGNSGLSKLYSELPDIKLPDHLDAAILAEAHRAVNARPGGKPKHRWTIPLGLVASLVVVVMVGMQLPYMLKDATPPQQPMEQRITAAMDNSVAERSVVVSDERKKVQGIAPLIEKGKSESADVEPMPAIAEAPAPVRANAPMQAAPASPVAAKRMQLREHAEGMMVSKEKKSADAEEYSAYARQPSVPAAASMSPPMQIERAPLVGLKDEAGKIIPGPEEFINNIKRLKQAGNLEQARKEWELFKKHYPNYPVPEGIEFR